MIIAVPFEKGKIFGHFGKTETFKIYETIDCQIENTGFINADGQGHGALAGLLADNNVNVVICGGIGPGAMGHLEDAGIAVISGAEGEADHAVMMFLNEELESAGENCEHHENNHGGNGGQSGCGGASGCGGQSGCGGASGCGSCGGGCGSQPQPVIEGPNAGKICKVHYKGTFNDGSQFDSSYDRNEPLEFICGIGMMIYGFDVAVANMEVGQIIDVHLMPEEAYGLADPRAVFSLPVNTFPGLTELSPGQRVYLQKNGQPFPVTVVSIDDERITFDANDEMAGKELNFTIELLEVQENDY